MRKVSIQRVEDLRWAKVGDIAQANARSTQAQSEVAELSQTDRDAGIIFHQPGDDVTPQLFEVEYGPDARIALHAHDEDEIMYVVAGEMRFGTEVLKPGSSVYIPGGAYYSFRTGSDGLRFLNFRPRADMTYHVRGGGAQKANG